MRIMPYMNHRESRLMWAECGQDVGAVHAGRVRLRLGNYALRMDDTPMMTTADMAKRLNVSTDTVRRMCNAGKWPHARIGRLYRFTEEQYLSITAPPQAPEPWSKARREDIARMLTSLSL